jgi:hypothetical protein
VWSVGPLLVAFGLGAWAGDWLQRSGLGLLGLVPPPEAPAPLAPSIVRVFPRFSPFGSVDPIVGFGADPEHLDVVTLREVLRVDLASGDLRWRVQLPRAAGALRPGALVRLEYLADGSIAVPLADGLAVLSAQGRLL